MGRRVRIRITWVGSSFNGGGGGSTLNGIVAGSRERLKENNCAGYSPEVLEQRERWRGRIRDVLEGPDVPEAGRKIFVPKHELPKIKNYRERAPVEFWRKFPVNKVGCGKSWVDPVKLRSIAEAVGYRDEGELEKVCKDLEEGADIGCRGEARQPTVSRNAEGVWDYPEHITDAVAGWVAGGIALGPLDPADRPADAKVNGIMVKPKPNGSVRIILNLSAPAGRSVNDGIDVAEFPATMTSTQKWLAVLNKAGRGALMVKLDWAEAYKHIRVRPEDRCLQYFSWLGMDFVELALIFGSKSSVGIYDRLAKVVLRIVVKLAKFGADMVCQHLDDVCAAAAAGSRDLHRFEEVYRKVAEQVGVRLAPTDDKEKAFSPCTRGVVLGVLYDTENWSWEIPADKVGRLVAQIRAALGVEELRQDEMWSVAGRIMHYAPLMPGGRFNLDLILKANGESELKSHMVKMTVGLKRQLHFWLLMVQAVSGWCRIPAEEKLPVWVWEVYTDAAGGTMESVGRGSGGVARGFWFYVPWSRRINGGGRAEDGKKLARKLSALELVGPLVTVAAAFDRCRGRPVRIWVDNSGSVRIWAKGYSSSCGLCTTLVKAIAAVAAAAGCRLAIEKITRRSVPGAVLADALSKAEFPVLWAAREEWDLPLDPARVPGSLLEWLDRPREDPELGGRILEELRRTKLVLGYNC